MRNTRKAISDVRRANLDDRLRESAQSCQAFTAADGRREGLGRRYRLAGRPGAPARVYRLTAPASGTIANPRRRAQTCVNSAPSRTMIDA